MIRRFLRDQSGHTAIEYSMIAAVGAIAIVTSVQFMGDSIATMFQTLVDAWANART